MAKYSEQRMEPLLDSLQRVFRGAILTNRQDRIEHSRDASIYEIVPEAVLEPKDSKDIQALVSFVQEHKINHPGLALTTRSAGTDMSGAAIGNSLIVSMTQHFSHSKGLDGTVLHTQPGVFIRDIDPILAAQGLMLGSAPAGHAVATIGGMVGNNSGGEQSLRFGNTEYAVRELQVVFADGKEYTVAPLTKKELDVKMRQKTFEGRLYKQVYELIEGNYDLIHNARPKIKNTMGYNLWSVWDRDTGIFDMTRLLSGSQGTLGIITDIKIEAVPKAPYISVLLVSVSSYKKFGQIAPLIMKSKPATFEGSDDTTFNRPKILLTVGFEGQTKPEVYKKITALHDALKKFHVRMSIEDDKSVKNSRAWPFIDDMVVRPAYLPQFLPEVRRVIRKHKLPAILSGHVGDGNFHLVPSTNTKRRTSPARLEPIMRELIPLVLKYKGTLAGEHNDGMVRGPWLPAVFGTDMFTLFKVTKEIFDPSYLFNPHKKTDASWEYSMDHVQK